MRIGQGEEAGGSRMEGAVADLLKKRWTKGRAVPSAGPSHSGWSTGNPACAVLPVFAFWYTAEHCKSGTFQQTGNPIAGTNKTEHAGQIESIV